MSVIEKSYHRFKNGLKIRLKKKNKKRLNVRTQKDSERTKKILHILEQYEKLRLKRKKGSIKKNNLKKPEK